MIVEADFVLRNGMLLMKLAFTFNASTALGILGGRRGEYWIAISGVDEGWAK